MSDASLKPAVSAPPPAMHAPAAADGPSPKRADWLRIALLTMLWGSSFAMVELTLETLRPAVIVNLRMWIGALTLLAVAAAVRSPLPRLWPRPDPAWKWLAGVALVGNTVPFFLIPWAQQTTTSGMTGIVIATAPLFVALLGHFLLGERLTPRRSLGLAVAFAGVGVLFAPTIFSGIGGGADGQALAIGALLLSATLYAFTIIMARLNSYGPMIGGSAAVCLIAAIVTTPLGLWDAATHGIEFSQRSGAAMLALGVGPTALATIVYLATARSAGAGFLSLTNYIVPLFSVTLGALLLDEALEPRALIALALILAGVLLAGRRRKAQAQDAAA